MAAPAPRTLTAPGTQDGPPEPVPVAWLGRTSTLALQDPAASLRRQLRSAQDWLPPGWFIAAWYWDIESGGLDLEARGRNEAWRQFTGIGIPRDGGLPDLLADAQAPAPKFAAVIVEDIERSARDTFTSLRIEKELSAQGILLFATDEPVDIEGVNANTILVRRVKQGIAEWYRFSLKKACWKGLVDHSLEGWNIGPAPYGYLPDRVPHPVPVKASQGRTKTRLALDPVRAPVVVQIFTWRVIDKLGAPTIAARLNADPARYPAPGRIPGWTRQAVHVILRNPKYTGHMVFGRRRTRNGRRIQAPAKDWLWSPAPVHPALIDRATWDEAQKAGQNHATSRDTLAPDGPEAGPVYPYRSRCRCKQCHRRMAGRRYGPRAQSTYYRCPHDPANPRHAAAVPGHPPTVQAPEKTLDRLVGDFFNTYVFGPDRAALVAAQLPATQADAQAARDADRAALTLRLKHNETAKNAQILAFEHLPDDPDAAADIRTRIFDRFAELRTEHDQLQNQLDALDVTPARPADLTLLDQLPLTGDPLPRLDPQTKAQLFQALNLEILWNPADRQATIWVEITEATLHAIPAILNPDHDGYHDTRPDPDQLTPAGEFDKPPRAGMTAHQPGVAVQVQSR
jgi:site-specific DNA recombinase